MSRLPHILAIATLIVLVAPGCRQTECGEGTHLEGGECVSNIPINCTGPGVEFRDGRCQASADVCGPGTELDLDSGLCLPGEHQPADVDTADVEPDAAADAEPDLPTTPSCPEESATGFICLSGLVIDWSTGAPVRPSEPLVVIVDDLTLRSQTPDKPPFSSTELGEGGSFVLDVVSLLSPEGELQQMILVVDESEAAETNSWQRTLTGVPATPSPGTSYPGLTAFAVPGSLVDQWNAALNLSADELLERVGFMVLRVLDLDGNPVAGATVRALDPGHDTLAQKHYLSADLGSIDGEQTSESGAVLIVGGPIGQYTADADGMTFTPTLGGSTPGIAVATVLVGATD